MVGTTLGTKGRNPMNSSSIKGREVAMNSNRRHIRRKEEKTWREQKKRNLTKENRKTKW